TDQKITVAGAAFDKPDRDQVYRKAIERLSLRPIYKPTQKSPATYSATGLFLCNGGEIGRQLSIRQCPKKSTTPR
ncbi:hypothetical protein NTD89_10870, partial [Pseudomonas sp. 14P_5.3_Bac1]|uniref:hypothetical protein n=1 Tax=Pseudomonas sp. 14P_5.3_Bac1 TaxID=2971622 RepID=UPI0021C64509